MAKSSKSSSPRKHWQMQESRESKGAMAEAHSKEHAPVKNMFLLSTDCDCWHNLLDKPPSTNWNMPREEMKIMNLYMFAYCISSTPHLSKELQL